MSRYAVRLELWRAGELMLSKTTPPDGAVVVGPTSSATVPTAALQANLPLLCRAPGAAGYAMKLAAPLGGAISAADRLLRIEDGLLRDPRPEPLLLTDGDRGELRLDADLRLRFFVVAVGRRFRTLNPMDWKLGCALAATAVLALIATAIVLAAVPRPPDSRADRSVRLIAVQSPLLRRLTPPVEPPATNVAQASTTTKEAQAPRQQQPSTARRRGAARARQHRRHRGRAHQRLLAALDNIGGTTLTSSARIDVSRWSALGRGLTSRSFGASPPGRAVTTLRLDAPASRESRRRLLSRRTAPATGPSRDVIARVVARGRGKIQHCFERQLLIGGKQLEGRILVRWRIGPEGRAEAIRIVEDTVGSPQVRRCVTQTVGRWSFPAAATAITVVYPFEFFVDS